MTGAKRKRSVICISSSDEEEEEESEVEEIADDDSDSDEGESEAEEIDGEEDSEFEESDDDEDEGISEDEEKDSSNVVAEDDEALCKHVISLLQEGKGLEALSLRECKAYLRKHGIRLAGNKAVCIHRIEEHWRISKRDAESLYPRSSFVINCTGDVCKGDVVLFRQKVYEKFNKVTRNGNVRGMRTIAGRVVKESYGSARQQHTFTVEVLWSKGFKKLSPLFPLLVKGRNLYKLKTFRQRWVNEAERLLVLAEKHRRGTAARAVRAIKRSKSNQTAKRQHLNEGRKVPKCSQYRKPSEISKGKLANGHKKNTSTKTRNHHRKASSSRQLNLKGNVRSDVTYNLNWRHPNHGHPNIDMDPSLHSHGHPRQGTVPWQMEFHSQNLPSQFTGRNFSSSSTMVSPPLARPYAGPYYRNNIHHYPSNPNYNDIPESLDAERQFRELHRTREPFGQRRRSSQ